MKFFNLDLHISVIADIKKVFNDLGHQVDNWTISGHSHIMGRPIDEVEFINQHTWRGIDDDLIEKFYQRYKNQLQQYDGFIVTHTPCFAMLYEKFNKPIVTVASTRFEDPFSNDMIKWMKFNNYLKTQIDNGLVIPVANNKYDKAYTELYTEREWQHIPSLCEYTNAQYTGKNNQFLYSSKFKIDLSKNPLVEDKDSALKKGYKWQDLADFKGIVHIPYNASTMSIFEQYTANIPLFFPSYEFMHALREQYYNLGVLSELSWNQVHNLSSNSTLFNHFSAGLSDPNNYLDNSSMMEWVKLSDFYDNENMPHIQYFNSFNHLDSLLKSANTESISNMMKQANEKRKSLVYQKWKDVLSKLES